MKKILFVDEPDFNQAVQASLLAAGFEVVLASSCKEALEHCQRLTFDVIMTGNKLVDGLELVRELKRLDIKTPVIVMSGYGGAGGESELDEYRKLGVTNFLGKPYTFDELMASARKIIP